MVTFGYHVQPSYKIPKQQRQEQQYTFGTRGRGQTRYHQPGNRDQQRSKILRLEAKQRESKLKCDTPSQLFRKKPGLFLPFPYYPRNLKQSLKNPSHIPTPFSIFPLTNYLNQDQTPLSVTNPPSPTPQSSTQHRPPASHNAAQETKKLRKFVMLPGKITGVAVGQDPTWVQVYMEGVDEVGAHCGLFFFSPLSLSLISFLSPF